MDERLTFSFFRSFYDAAKNIPDKAMQADFLMAICEYALNGNEPEGSGIISALFALVKPNLDISRKRAQAGKKGGEAGNSKNDANTQPEEAPEEQNEANGSKSEANESKMQKPASDKGDRIKDKGRGIKEEEEGDREGDGDGSNISSPSPAGEEPPSHADSREKIPYAAIRDAYNEICRSFPKCSALSDKRKAAIRARIHSGGYTFADFQRLFQKAEASAFLRGENKKNWRATFDWLLSDANMAKVLDGNYDDREAASAYNRPNGKPDTGFQTSNPFLEMLNEERERQ